MADEYPKSDTLKNVEGNQEKMEEGEVCPASGKVAASTPQSPKGDSASPGDASVTVRPEASVQPEAEPGTSPKAAEVGTSPKGATAEEKKPGFLKNVKKACKNVLTRISPRKHDKVPFVPEGATGGESSTAAPAVAASGKTKPPKGRRGTLIVDSPTSESRTQITEVSASSDDADFPEEAARKASVVSSDTAANISLFSNVEESGSKEPVEEAMSPEEEKEEAVEESDVAMESDQ